MLYKGDQPDRLFFSLFGSPFHHSISNVLFIALQVVHFLTAYMSVCFRFWFIDKINTLSLSLSLSSETNRTCNSSSTLFKISSFFCIFSRVYFFIFIHIHVSTASSLV